MANEFKDVLRVEVGAGYTGLQTILRNKQTGYENDGTYRQGRKLADGDMIYWTPDGHIGATGIQYTNDAYPSVGNVEEALDLLMYTAPTITSFTNDAGTVYKGSTVTGFDAAWTISGTILSQTLTGKSPDPEDRDATYSGLSLTTTTTYTLTITDDISDPVDTATTTIYFRLRKYYGTSASGTPNEAAIEAGTATASIDTASSRALSSTSIAGGGNYPFYSYPAAWGDVSLTVNGFASTWNKTTVSVTSAEGNTENYYVYTSPNQVVGSITLAATAA
jgi:hypothetical protein